MIAFAHRYALQTTIAATALFAAAKFWLTRFRSLPAGPIRINKS